MLPPRPFACLPMSRRSLTSRTMNTSTIGSSRPCRFCEATMTGDQVEARDEHDDRAERQHERVDPEEDRRVPEALADARSQPNASQITNAV